MGLVKKIDSGIAIALKNDRIQTRPGASPGFWAIALLPISVIFTASTWPVSDVYKMCTVCSINLLLNGVLLLCHMKSYGTLSVVYTGNINCLAPVIVTTFFYMYLGLDFYHAVCHSLSNGLIFFEAVPYFLKVFPKSFSFGEACIAAQATVVLIYGTFVRLSHIMILSGPLIGDLEIATTVLQVIVLLALVVCLIPKSWTPARQYLTAFTILSLGIPILYVLLGYNVIYWFLEFIFERQRLRLICGGAVCSGFAWGTVVLQVRSQRKASTATRKIFHFLAVVVFLSGVLMDPLLLYFAAGLAFTLFILIEFIRTRKLAPFATALQYGFQVYADEKDAGGVALTPIYLLIGCALPLALLPNFKNAASTLPLLAGVLSIGIGDSCASIIGQHFGRQKWSGSAKTIEGSIACIAGQATTLLVLSSLGYLPVNTTNLFRLIKPLLAVSVASLVEAKTDQVDNLILPFVTYILLLI